MSEIRLTTRDVHLERGGKVIAALPDLAVSPGETVALAGVSGSGKTTALMALSGIRNPASGRITIDDKDIWTLGRRGRDRFRGRHIGLVFQSFHLIDALSVAANLAIAARCAGLPADEKRLDYLLDKLGIGGLRHKRADLISHGQAQRVAVARALFNRPAVVLADEPTSALDDINAAALLRLLKEAARAEAAALVIASHDARVLDQVDKVVKMESCS